MRRDVILLGFVAAVFVFGAALSPWIYFAVQAAGAIPGAAALAANPFPRFLSRVLLALAVGGLFPLFHWLRLSRRELGLCDFSAGKIGRGFLAGLIGCGGFLAVSLVLGAREMRSSISGSSFFTAAVLAAGAAVLVAPLEELLFRGVLFGQLRRPNRPGAALIVSSAIFALVHFLHTSGKVSAVRWDSGFAVLWQMVRPSSVDHQWLARFVNLALCGVILAWAVQRTGTLWFSMGLHAGWILLLKLGNSVTGVPAGTTLWGTRKVIDGWGTTIALGVTLIGVHWLTRGRATTNHEPQHSSIVAGVG